MMDDWLKGVLAGAGAVLVASAWTMRQTASTVRSEAEDSPFDDLPRENAQVGGVDFQAEMSEVDFTNPEFAVTPSEDFSDLPRQNNAVGGYDFNAEDYSGEYKDASSPETYSPAEDTLFNEPVVQDEQDGGVDFMNADDVSIDPLAESPTSEDPATAGASDLGGPDDSLGAVPVETQAQEAGMMASHEIEPPLGRGVAFNLGAETDKEKRRAKWARKMRGSLKHSAESAFDRLEDEIADEYEEKGMSDKEAKRIGAATAYKIGVEKYGKARMAKAARDHVSARSLEAEGYSDSDPMDYNAKSVGGPAPLFNESIVHDDADLPPSHWVEGNFEAEGDTLADTEPSYTPDTGMPIPDGIEPAGPSDTFAFRAEARRWRLPKTSKGTALYAKRDKEGKFTDIQNVTRASRIDRAIKAKTHGVPSGDGDEGERAFRGEARRWRLPKTSKGTALYAKRDEEGKFTDIQNVTRASRIDRAIAAKTHGVPSGDGDEGERALRAEGARRWRLPKTSKGTALYAKRDAAGKFTDIQNVTRASRTDRAIKAKTHGVASGHGDEGERAKASPDFLELVESPFRRISDMVSSIMSAESSNQMGCASCDSFWAECDCKGSEYYEASGSNYMKPKDAAAIFAKNKNKLCSVTFTKKDGSTRTLTGRTGVFRARDGSTIVGKGRKPTWDAKARAKAGFITMWDADAARKAGDNRAGFRVVNLHTISSIRAMGHTYDAAHPRGN